jgi:hypothetical protein
MGTNFTPCKKPSEEEGWAETQVEPSELLPCARSLFFLHCPPPRALHYAYARVLLKFFLPLYLVGTHQVSKCQKKLHKHFEKWGERFYMGTCRFSLLSSVEYCCWFWLLLSIECCRRFSLLSSIEYCCWFWLLLSIESRRWFWLLLSSFWPNPKVNSWVLLTFTTDNFTIIDNMNRTTYLTLKIVTCLVSMCGIHLDS